MSELIVIGYETPERAEEARADLMTMAREYLVDVADAVAAVVDDEGNVKLNQMVNLWTAGAASGAELRARDPVPRARLLYVCVSQQLPEIR